MESKILYDTVAMQAARNLTLSYSTSFGMASRLFDASIRPDIYAVYGLVRIADEIVDTYRGEDAAEQLQALAQETYDAIRRGYSANLIVHAFQLTASRCAISEELIKPFFASMAMDLAPSQQYGYDRDRYERYIYGSAEVVGLMCLRVFTQSSEGADIYDELASGARALGSAYQKVNFLRDLAEDRTVLERNYFPELQNETLTEAIKELIIADIEQDFAKAESYIARLPTSARAAVDTSYRYYYELLKALRRTPADTLIDRSAARIRISDGRKTLIFGAALLRRR